MGVVVEAALAVQFWLALLVIVAIGDGEFLSLMYAVSRSVSVAMRLSFDFDSSRPLSSL